MSARSISATVMIEMYLISNFPAKFDLPSSDFILPDEKIMNSAKMLQEKSLYCALVIIMILQ